MNARTGRPLFMVGKICPIMNDGPPAYTCLDATYEGASPNTMDFAYDGEGRRIRKRSHYFWREPAGPGGIELGMTIDGEGGGGGGDDWVYRSKYVEGHYLYDGDALVAAFDENNNVSQFYINSPSGPVGVYFMNYDEYLRYFVKDQVLSTRVMVDGNGDVVEYINYHPFGETMEAYKSYSERMEFAGKESDEFRSFDYDYFGARYYDPQLGVFSTTDPAANGSPGFNLYGYCLNNPLQLVDQNGESVQPTGPDSLNSVNAINNDADATNLDLGIDPNTGRVNITGGKLETLTDILLYWAIISDSINVMLNTTRTDEVATAYDKHGKATEWHDLFGGLYNGSKIDSQGRVITSQYVNIGGLEGIAAHYPKRQDMSAGRAVLHEILESYSGALLNPGMGYTDKYFHEAHNAALKLGPHIPSLERHGRIDNSGRGRVLYRIKGEKGSYHEILIYIPNTIQSQIR